MQQQRQKPFAHAAADENTTVSALKVKVYRIPTSSPESDGTLEWNATTLVVVHIAGGGMEGFGYTYASMASAILITETLQDIVIGTNIFNIPYCHMKMCAAVRNLGKSGVAACAISAVDNALWDLKAKLLNKPLIETLGAARNLIAVYGSGGFTSYGTQEITRQMEGWRQQGIGQFKIKIGRNRQQDLERMDAALRQLPKGGKLFVDANGAYHAREALRMAEVMKDYGVAWYEEPVPSDDEAGLRFVREQAPACMDISAGEYGYGLKDFHRLLDGKAVDVLQADATRCLGVTGFLKAAALSETYHCLLSSHCAPALHAALMCHIPNAAHVEYFWDHVRIESMLFDGVSQVRDGFLTPQTELPGFGFILKVRDAEKYEL